MFTPGAASIQLIQANRSSLRVTNSLFENTSITSFQTTAVVTGPIATFAHSTFLIDSALEVCTNPSVNHTFRFENSIFVAKSAFDVFQNPNLADCTFTSTLLSRQATPPAGTFVADPRFVSSAMRDFHLLADSPAIDRATLGTLTTDHDLDGVPRPQGVQNDVGAYERQP
jgi:hypothetical protein